MKTNLKTKHSKSPVISIAIRYGHMVKEFKLLLALTNEGNIYRTCKIEECDEVSEFETEISPGTALLISEKNVNKYINLTELGKKIEIQNWLNKGVAYISYRVGDEPLFSLETSRYYDVL